MRSKTLIMIVTLWTPISVWGWTAKDFGFEQSNKLAVNVTPLVHLENDKVTYIYTVFNQKKSEQPMVSFYVEIAVPFEGTEMSASSSWRPMGCCATDEWRAKATGKKVVTWIIATDSAMVQAGSSMDGFKLSLKSLPGIKSFYAQGYTPSSIPQGEFDGEEYLAKIELQDLFNNSYSGLTVAPDAIPDAADATVLINRLVGLSQQATKLQWLSKTFSTNEVEKYLKKSKDALSSKNDAVSRSSLEQLRTALDGEKAKGSKNLTDNGYYLLKPNVDFILSKLSAHAK